jgi:hypothetical protein
MNYRKPELMVLSAAVVAVQGSSNKGLYIHMDAFYHATPAAYESDE